MNLRTAGWDNLPISRKNIVYQSCCYFRLSLGNLAWQIFSSEGHARTTNQ